MNKIVLCLLVLNIFSFDTQALNFRRSAGTMSVGGALTFPFEWDPVRKASLHVNFAPEWGIFLFDGFELLLKTHLKTALLHNRTLELGARDARWNWGLGAGFSYIFNSSWPVLPFVGFAFGFEMAKFIITTARATIDIPVGLLLPLSENFALSFGVTTQVALVAQLKIFDKIRIEPGFLGIKAVF